MAGDKISINYFNEKLLLEIINEKKLYKVILRLSFVSVAMLVAFMIVYLFLPFLLYLTIIYDFKEHVFFFICLMLCELLSLKKVTIECISLIKDIKFIYNTRSQQSDEKHLK